MEDGEISLIVWEILVFWGVKFKLCLMSNLEEKKSVRLCLYKFILLCFSTIFFADKLQSVYPTRIKMASTVPPSLEEYDKRKGTL
jgi:hypothetical protein